MMKRWTQIVPNVRGATRRLDAILATGLPGLYRVIAFFGVQKLYSLGDLGRTGVAFSIAQSLAFFTAIGWAGLILVRVPAAPDHASRVQRFYELAFMGIMTLGVCSAMIAIVGRLHQFDFPVLETVVILIGWTIYQLARHYFLSYRDYRFIVLSDVVLLLITFLSIFGFRKINAVAGLPLAFSLALSGLLMLARIGRPRKFEVPRYDPKGLEFGFTNFLSGGIALSLVPIASYTDGVRFAGLMSLIGSICAISALIPRAITMYRLPELSRIAAAGESLHDLTRRTNRAIQFASIAAFVGNAVFIAAICYRNTTAGEFFNAFKCGLAISAIGCISMSSMAHSSVLMVREASRSAVLINLIACGAYIGTTLLLYVSGGLHFFAVLTACIAVTVMRNLLLKAKSTSLCTPANSVSRS
ncbi:hypothetical protein NOV72_01294 [Caballeronia novacaledonica]|uniref:Polysaccharide biosynthesis protein n=1 Tax=Caballeronia novacaledonica TaxID=1544861 RepID=A0A2U3I1P5_9BURK|nr:hypothetical protein [Caballeronia novacaledonica]SPB14045.1 hypothetical protein NOV72_01294 [Caballeronia novacaledonica]